MTNQAYILVNFGCGRGPFLRAIDLALAVRARLRRLGGAELIRILVPLVYREEMFRVIQEDFGGLLREDPNLFVFDPRLGHLSWALFYDGADYAITLNLLATAFPLVQQEIDKHLSGTLECHTLAGRTVMVSPEQIICSVSRNPNVRMGPFPSFYTSIGYLEKILRRTEKESWNEYPHDLLTQASEHVASVELQQTAWFQPIPSTFSFESNGVPWNERETQVPPLFHPPREQVWKDDLPQGLYVLISGIPNLGRLYKQVKRFGWVLYANEKIEGAPNLRILPPSYISHPAMVGVYARAGWNTVWHANLARKPLICPPFVVNDAPEIYFNNHTIETLRLGTLLPDDMMLDEAIARSREFQGSIDAYYGSIRARFGTLDGIEYSADTITASLQSGRVA